MTDYGRSAVNISSPANGALGELRRHDTDGIRLEIAAPSHGTPGATAAPNRQNRKVRPPAWRAFQMATIF
jgi:hypothetical protein